MEFLQSPTLSLVSQVLKGRSPAYEVIVAIDEAGLLLAHSFRGLNWRSGVRLVKQASLVIRRGRLDGKRRWRANLIVYGVRSSSRTHLRRITSIEAGFAQISWIRVISNSGRSTGYKSHLHGTVTHLILELDDSKFLEPMPRLLEVLSNLRCIQEWTRLDHLLMKTVGIVEWLGDEWQSLPVELVGSCHSERYTSI